MLQKLGDHIAECRRRASECEALAKDGLDEAVAAQYRAMAKHWTRLADSYEFNVTLERFLHDMHEAGARSMLKISRSRPVTTIGPTEARELVMAPFRQHHDSFNPETLALLEAALNDTWAALQSNGSTFDEVETRTAIADLIVKFAQQGERDPQKLKALALAALPSYAQEQ